MYETSSGKKIFFRAFELLFRTNDYRDQLRERLLRSLPREGDLLRERLSRLRERLRASMSMNEIGQHKIVLTWENESESGHDDNMGKEI
jgi:hypothetical protein